jgi:hypothetical protein
MRESTPLSVDNLEVLIVDDRSTDGTKAIGSAIKTETGWGWTWRGRTLQINS